MPDCDLNAQFFRYFKPVHASTSELLQEAFRIRHKVFAEELGYEPISPQAIESDEYDDHSFHYLLQHITRNEYAGTVRLIVSPPDDENYKLPFERYCSHGIDPELLDSARLKPGTYAEVSRLAVPESFRRRKGEKGKTVSITTAHEDAEAQRSSFPYIPIGLYLICSALFIITRLETIFVMVEPRLARHLSRFGIKFTQAGPAIDYHGRRALYYITQADLQTHLKPEVKGLLSQIQDMVHADIQSPNAQRPPIASTF